MKRVLWCLVVNGLAGRMQMSALVDLRSIGALPLRHNVLTTWAGFCCGGQDQRNEKDNLIECERKL